MNVKDFFAEFNTKTVISIIGATFLAVLVLFVAGISLGFSGIREFYIGLGLIAFLILLVSLLFYQFKKYNSSMRDLLNYYEKISVNESLEGIADIVFELLFNNFGIINSSLVVVDEKGNNVETLYSRHLSKGFYDFCENAYNNGNINDLMRPKMDIEALDIKDLLLVLGGQDGDDAFDERQTLTESHIHGFDKLLCVPLIANNRKMGWFNSAVSKKGAGNKEVVQLIKMLSLSISAEINNHLLIKSAFHEIEERKKSEQEMLLAKDAAERANSVKDDFLANISHEIRTPLNSILGYSDFIISECKGEPADSDEDIPNDEDLFQEDSAAEKEYSEKDDKISEYAEIIKKSGNILLSLLNDVLDLAKMEAYSLTVVNTPTSISKVMGELIYIFKPEADKKSLELSLDIVKPFPRYVDIDEKRLKQIILNLLGNAIKFTDSGYVRLGVSAREKDDRRYDLTFSVSDSGRGIDREIINKVFDPFFQVSGASNRSHEGTGLGLSISKKLVDILGGSISMISNLDEGTEVLVFIRDVLDVTASMNPLNVKIHSDDDVHMVNDTAFKKAELEGFELSDDQKQYLADNLGPILKKYKGLIISSDINNIVDILIEFDARFGFPQLFSLAAELQKSVRGFEIEKTRELMGILVNFRKSNFDI